MIKRRRSVGAVGITAGSVPCAHIFLAVLLKLIEELDHLLVVTVEVRKVMPHPMEHNLCHLARGKGEGEEWVTKGKIY